MVSRGSNIHFLDSGSRGTILGDCGGKHPIKVMGISGLSVKWSRQARIWLIDLREKIGKGGDKMPDQGL